jgi:general secretion pathway protein M
MIANLDKNRQRQLALAILVAFIAALLCITALPIWAANASRNATLAEGMERLQRYEQIAARDKELLPQYEAMIRKQKSAGNHLRSDTPAVAGAELQRLVKSIASRNKAQIVSTQILPAGEEQGFVRVALTVRVRGTLPAVLQSFHDIESDDIYMFLDNVSLRDNMVGRSQFKVELRPIDAEFDLIAYMPESS